MIVSIREDLRPRGGWPAPDPAAVEAARERLEAAASAVPEGTVLYVNKWAIRDVFACEERHLALAAERAGSIEPTPAMVRGRLVDAAFRQIALGVGYGLGADPYEDAVEACAAADDPVDDLLATFDADTRTEIEEAVRSAAHALVDRWSGMEPRSAIRTQQPIRVPLADGRVVLSGRPDLVLGDRPPTEVVVELKSGGYHQAARDEARFYALLEALRFGVAPARAVTIKVDGDRVIVDGTDVDAELLEFEAVRVADGIHALARLAAGGKPRRAAGWPCGRCPVTTCDERVPWPPEPADIDLIDRREEEDDVEN